MGRSKKIKNENSLNQTVIKKEQMTKETNESEPSESKEDLKTELKLLKKKKKSSEDSDSKPEKSTKIETKFKQCYKTFPVHFIDDLDFIGLIREYSKMTAEDIYYGFGWEAVEQYVFCPNIKKTKEDLETKDLGTEEEFLEYFVWKGVLPEGHYMILIT